MTEPLSFSKAEKLGNLPRTPRGALHRSMSAFEITSEPTKDHPGRHVETTSAAGLNEMIRLSMVADEEKAAALAAAAAEDGDALDGVPGAEDARVLNVEDELASAVESGDLHRIERASTSASQLTGSSSPSLDGSPSRKHVRRQSRVEHVELPTALVDAVSSNMTRLLQLFAVWDTDGDGTIGPKEFERALIALGLVPNRDDARKLFELLDQDESGAVSVEELIRLKSAIEAAKRGRGARAEGSAAEQSRFSRANTQHGLFGGRKLAFGSASDPARKSFALLRAYVIQPMLGALWKQPLQPHHALSGEGDWMAEAAALRKRHFHYEPGLVESVREHVLGAQAGLQEGCSQATHELGELLSEVRQADLKLMELRLSQRKQAKEEEDVVSRFSVYLQYLAADLERALINIERYALPLRGPEAPKRGKSGRMITDNARASDVARRCSFADFKGGAKASAPAADHGRRGDEGLGQRSDPDGGLFGAEFATAAHGLAGAPIARWLDKFAPLPGQKKQLRCVAQVYLGLVAAWVIVTLIGFALDVRVGVRETCELYHYVCAAPWGVNNDTYICGLGGPENDTITVAPASCDAAGLMVRAAVDALNGTSLAATTAACSTATSTSWLYILPLPLDVAISVWPTRMWRRNMHNKAVRKLILWTPTVPLVLLQLLMRAAVLCSVARYSQDLTFAIVNAVEGFALLLQTFVFIFMDAQKVTAPGMRSLFALTMIGRFFVSFYLRQTTIKWVEQYPLLPQTGLTAGFGTSSRQSIISSIDYTVIALMASSLLSVLLHPTELAIVRIRADVQGYLNWRDHYIKRMALQATRRDQDVADAALRVKSWFTHARWAKQARAIARASTLGSARTASRRRKRSEAAAAVRRSEAQAAAEGSAAPSGDWRNDPMAA